MNQYGLIAPVDYNEDNTSAKSKVSFNSQWPKSMGVAFSTKLEQDQQDGDYVFNLMLTQEEVDRMPRNDNPNFVFQYEGELDSEGEPFPTPTFKVKIMDGSEPPVWTGDYREQNTRKQ
jgi:hypothetical protein